MDTNSYLQKWSEKLSLSLEDIKKEFNVTLEKEKSNQPDLEKAEQSALKTLALQYKKMLRSSAVGFEGIIIGASDCNDIIARQRKTAEDLYLSDPQQAIAQGITDEEGNPLDTKPQWNNGKTNPRFGKPLPQNAFIRNLFGVATKVNSGQEPKFFSITVNGEGAVSDDIPMFKPIRFMGIDRTPQGVTNQFTLNASQFTTFVEDNTLDFGTIEEIIRTVCGDKIVNLNDLNAYHIADPLNYNRVAIVIADVSQIGTEPTAFGSRIMMLEDLDNLEDIDAKGLTCWISERTPIDFAEGNKVIVVGRTGQSKVKDENGNVTEELGDVTMGVYGVFPIPDPVTETAENLTTE